MFAEVIIEYPVKSLDKTFTYKIPKHLESSLKIGMKVYVPFGNQNVNGFVLNIINEYNNEFEIKEIYQVIDEFIVLSPELLKLGNYMSEKTLCPRIMAYQTMFPPAYKVKNKKTNYNIYDTFYSLNISEAEVKNYIEKNKNAKKQIEILNILLKNKKVDKKNILSPSLKILLNKNIILEEKIQKYRINNIVEQPNNIDLTENQKAIFNKIEFQKNNTYLLWGITGSGKTEVYIKVIEEVLKNGKTAIVLVPEISLTMQIVKRFYNKFGNNVAVFHSALSEGEKHDEYLKIINNEVQVVVGTRSAIFVPLNNLGVIIIDEEHSDSYKQDNTPRYNAKDMADFRCRYYNIPLILGSATPTLESMARAMKKVFKLLILDKRVNEARLPEVIIQDMTLEMKKKNYIFSDLLNNSINECLRKKEQVIILLNRRGYSTFINCSSCGYTYKCPNCDITLTYHKSTNNLICHYCAYQIKKDNFCPKCQNESLNFLGLGTEKLENYIKENIKDAKVIRMDQDTTTKKGSHDKIIESFKNEEYNILLGTQMISKGLDFPNVTLVGVINADISLNIPDYKSNENTFSLLNQVAGRAGRSLKNGQVIIQTFNKDHEIFQFIQKNDYLSFYKSEMNFRRNLKYPPYYYLVSIKVLAKIYEKSLNEANKIVKYLKNNLDEKTIVLGPTTASIFKFNNYYRFQIIIKYTYDDNLMKVLKTINQEYNNNSVKLEIDINPNKI